MIGLPAKTDGRLPTAGEPAWAAGHGYGELVNYTQEENEPMRAINEQLGDREQRAWILVRRGV